MEYIKKAVKSAESDSDEIRGIVKGILDDIEKNGEKAVRELARKFDNWEGDFILSPEKKQKLIDQVPEDIKQDIRFAHEQIFGFAKAQKESISEFEKETLPGVRLGQRIVPMDVAGCYIPGGRFAHACSALMSVGTAKAAGVKTVIACSPPRGESIAPAVAYALDVAGADIIIEMGGVQAIATMAFGLFTGKPANILAGPGNAYVAEAKSILSSNGKCTIDVFAGPTESAIIADKTADYMTVAIDLVSQAEHGINSPVWLFTDSRELGEKVLEVMPKIIADMPDPKVPEASWRDYGEIVLCKDREELCRVNDEYAAEHVQVIAEDLEFWVKNLNSYGSLFLGEGSTVPHGDKCSGTNHILPTKKAGFYSGGLNVLKFLKIYTYQEISKDANKVISAAASRLSRVEGMEGHARACDWRLKKYFPGQDWDFNVYAQKKY
ncbi:sulfopropanediol 3-dehydrogenase [Desulfocicer vacuolatum DSM 3385]|uniref:Sulfopropanediol 3-dehydrogenase n=1 Tax=Desulfocicer vacuolatum DSM 3385 TaxID=1121400 RepID=A0A1W2DYV0_9BACT|nr:histidinol dehydrogenase [Desulfocicer vacuolatum]SMD02497.1 sulfopropanediol 3-dehydrogenase [Desulfocicer vacuolatum DSM 3385]